MSIQHDSITTEPGRAPPASLNLGSLAAITFFASAATMAVEIAAGRMIARHLGASIYSWTSVIGIVLAGLAIGNYAGGLIADRKSSRAVLSVILVIAAAACAIIPFADAFAAGWSVIWMWTWPARTAAHVAVAFLLPALSLGLIAPLVAKLGLDTGLPRGRVVGGLSAAGALGSIVGTFAAGFVLIETIGTMGVTCAASVVLVLMAIWLRPADVGLWVAAAVALSPVALVGARTGFDPSQISRLAIWRTNAASASKPILATESAYSYLEVYSLDRAGRSRAMKLDSLVHSEINLDRPHDLQYEYERIFAAITNRLHPKGKPVDAITIGGGGFVFPRWLAETRPGGRNYVVEIDPAVTDAAIRGFDLPAELPIKNFDMDGRVFIDHPPTELQVDWDLIYVDALSGYQVPYQLTTIEFVRGCQRWLGADGALLYEMIDIYASGELLGSMVKTLREVFPHVYVFAEPMESADWKLYRKPFVVAGFEKPFNADSLGAEYAPGYRIVSLTGADLDELVSRPRVVVLTDEFAPVENMIAPVVRQSAQDRAFMDWLVEIRRYEFVQAPDLAVRACDRALAVDWRPPNRASLLSKKAELLLMLGRFPEAEAAAREAVTLHTEETVAAISLARACVVQGRAAEALPWFEKALAADETDACRYDLILALQSIGRHDEAVHHCEILVSQSPEILEGYVRWALSLEALGRKDEARAKVQAALERDANHAGAKALLDRLGQ